MPECSTQITDTSDLPAELDRKLDRRRADRLSNCSPELVSLMRNPTFEPNRMISPLVHATAAHFDRAASRGLSGGGLGSCKGLAVAVLLSCVLWASLIDAVAVTIR